MNNTIQSRRERGYSLVETLIAMALLGTVLLSVMTLFVWGRKNVYSGKQMTKAVAVGTRVMEDLNALTRSNVQDAFNLSTATLSGFNMGTDAYTYSVKRLSTDTTNDAFGYLARWNAYMTQQSFTNGLITLVISPVDPLAVGAPSITASPIYRIRVYVEWQEESRKRFIVLETVKVDRLN